MPRARGAQCLNFSNGKTSYLLLKRKNPNFPLVANPASPNVGEIIGATVKDDDNDFYYTAKVVPQASTRKRLALKLTSNAPIGGDDIIDGLLVITLLIFTGPSNPPDQLPVSDVPVEYVDDPTGP